MAYGEKYRYFFYYDHNSSSDYYKVSFLEDGYASTVTELTPGVNPFSLDIKGQKDSIDQVIMGSAATFNIIVEKSDVSTIDADFLETNYQDMIVKLIKNPSGTPITEWVGILDPDGVTREYVGYKYNYELSAVDGLADLKNKFYSQNGLESGSPYTGFDTMLSIVKKALSKVASFSDLQLDLRVQLGTYSDQMTSTQNALKENEIAQELFFDVDDDGNQTYNTCYEVLQKILTPFYCTMVQSLGYYWILCTWERNTYYFEYDWSTLTQQSRIQNNRGASTFLLDFYGRGTFSKVNGYDSFIVDIYNREYNVELITNGDFDSNITGWTNGDVPSSANTWSTFAWYDYPGYGGTLGAAYSGPASAASYYFHTASTFSLTVGAGAPFVNLQFICEWNSVTTTGSSVPQARARLYNATDGYTTGSTGYTDFFRLEGFNTFTETFDVTGLTTGPNYLEIEIKITDAGTTAAQFYFDNIALTQESAFDVSDVRNTAIKVTSSQLRSFNQTIYIADQIKSNADLCAIKDSGGTYTSTWNRYGETDNLSLVRLFQQQYMNDNGEFSDYIILTAKDPSNTHNATIVPFYDSVEPAKIVGFLKNYREGTVEIQMKEIINSGLGSDVSLYYSSQNLGTQYGQEI